MAYKEAQGDGVTIRRANKGYSFFVESDGTRNARLRPTGDGDRVEILWWSSRDKWESIAAFGGVFLPLDEALNFVRKDPYGCLWLYQ